MWLIKDAFVGKKEFGDIKMHGTTIKKNIVASNNCLVPMCLEN